jgi:hypothetical protein
MTWTAALLPDDALPPDSLVARMLNPLSDETGTGDVFFDPEPTPMPLWRLMEKAYVNGEHATPDGRCGTAAVIEALRDWLLPEGPAIVSDSSPDDPIWARWNERQRLRTILTEQARIARAEP